MAMQKKSSKLDKMRMPERKKPMADELDMGEESSDMEMSPEGDMEMPAEMERSPELPDMSQLSDEDLMAEMKKRGLMGQMGDDMMPEGDRRQSEDMDVNY